MSTSAPTAQPTPSIMTGSTFNCTNYVGCQTNLTSENQQDLVLYVGALSTLVGLSVILLSSFFFDTGYSMFAVHWDKKDEAGTNKVGKIRWWGARNACNYFWAFVPMGWSIWLLTHTWGLYWYNIEYGGTGNITTGWGFGGVLPTNVNSPFYMFPRDTVRWWLITAAGVVVFLQCALHQIYGTEWLKNRLYANLWLPKLMHTMIVVALTAIFVLPSSIAYESSKYTHTQFNEIPFVFQNGTPNNYYYSIYTK